MEKQLRDAVEALIAERANAFRSGNMARANEIATELERFCIALTDERHGTSWRVGRGQVRS